MKLRFTLKLSLRKSWSRRLRTLNFMQDTSSFFCAHSALVWSTIWSRLVPFQSSFFAGWATANAMNEQRMMNFIMTKRDRCSSYLVYIPRKKIIMARVRSRPRTVQGRRWYHDWCQWVGHVAIYTKAYRRIVTSTSPGCIVRTYTHKPPTNPPAWPRIFFSFSMVFDYRGLGFNRD